VPTDRTDRRDRTNKPSFAASPFVTFVGKSGFGRATRIPFGSPFAIESWRGAATGF